MLMKLFLFTWVGLVACLYATARQPVPPAAMIVITEKDADKTFEAVPGQRIEVRLRGDRAMTGWEETTVLQPAVLQALKPDMVRDPRGNDAAIGTYVFRYQALKDGTVPLRFTYVYPGGPEVLSRKATQLVASMKVTVNVRSPAGR